MERITLVVLFISMTRKRLKHYLKTYRKRYGLSQKEIAYLLGANSPAKVSRYERSARRPNPETIFAYEVIFGIPAQELFAGTFDKVERQVMRRAHLLAAKLEKEKPTCKNERKIKLLRERISKLQSDPLMDE